MLPKERRLHRRDEIAHAIRTGGRVGSASLVVHAVEAPTGHRARLGLAVGKSVGNSVVRHRVSRRLRHVFADDVARWDEAGFDVVVRALPAAADAPSTRLASELASSRERLVRRARSGVPR